jgi:hypothetical protein
VKFPSPFSMPTLDTGGDEEADDANEGGIKSRIINVPGPAGGGNSGANLMDVDDEFQDAMS